MHNVLLVRLASRQVMDMSEEKIIKLLREFEENEKWFSENYQELQKKFENMILAIKDKKIISIKRDMESLLKDLESKNIDVESVYIGTVPPKGIAITPKDVLKLNVPIKRLIKATEHATVSLAGYKFWRYQLDGTVYVKNEEGKMVGIKLPISVLWPTIKKWPEEIKHIWSLVGSDFLRVGKFQLCFNPNEKYADFSFGRKL